MNVDQHKIYKLGVKHGRLAYPLAGRDFFISSEEYLTYEAGYLFGFDCNHAEGDMRDAMISVIRYYQSNGRRFG